MTQTVSVFRVHIPHGSTIGYGHAWSKPREVIIFGGDHRLMRDIGEAVQRGEVPRVEVEGWQVLQTLSTIAYEKGYA